MLNRFAAVLTQTTAVVAGVFDGWFTTTSAEVLRARHGDRAAYLRDVLTGSIEVESF